MSKNEVCLPSPLLFLSLVLLSIFIVGCGAKAETAKQSEESSSKTDSVSSKTTDKIDAEKIALKAETERNKGALIKIKEDSPADTVRVFYKRLREKKFRDALMLTNLRPAIEGLTDDEMKDLGVDFGFLAQEVPDNIPINGEIVSGNMATVTVKLPDEETKRPIVQEIKLRKNSDSWIVLVADENGEKRAKKEGKNYFFALRMDVHHDEAKAMLDRIGKAQMIYSMKYGGKFTDLKTLITKGFVPQDAKESVTTGYNYDVILSSNKVAYTALATPATYGKTGKLSFALKITNEVQPQLISKDLRGKPLQN